MKLLLHFDEFISPPIFEQWHLLLYDQTEPDLKSEDVVASFKMNKYMQNL